MDDNISRFKEKMQDVIEALDIDEGHVLIACWAILDLEKKLFPKIEVNPGQFRQIGKTGMLYESCMEKIEDVDRLTYQININSDTFHENVLVLICEHFSRLGCVVKSSSNYKWPFSFAKEIFIYRNHPFTLSEENFKKIKSVHSPQNALDKP